MYGQVDLETPISKGRKSVEQNPNDMTSPGKENNNLPGGHEYINRVNTNNMHANYNFSAKTELL